MKRWLMAALLATVTLFTAQAFGLDWAATSSWGMANAGLALDYAADSFLANPALLALPERPDTKFIVGVRYQDQIDSTYYTSGEVNPFLVEPITDWGLSFSAGSLAFSVQNRNMLYNRAAYTDYTQYDGLMTTLFQFDWATGWDPFYFGATVRATGQSERTGIEIKDNRTLLDYLVETLVGHYEVLDNSSTVSFGLGILLDYRWFKMGVVSNEFAYAYANDALVISADSLLKTLDWGFSLSSPTYDSNNQLHLLKFEGALDFINLGSDEDREFRMGLSTKLQLLPTWTISLLVGYEEPKETPSDLLAVNFDNGFQTFSLDVAMETVNITLSYGYPTAWYTGATTTLNPVLLASFTISL